MHTCVQLSGSFQDRLTPAMSHLHYLLQKAIASPEVHEATMRLHQTLHLIQRYKACGIWEHLDTGGAWEKLWMTLLLQTARDLGREREKRKEPMRRWEKGKNWA